MNTLNKPPSARAVYLWNITGSVANALLSVAALMLVTRMLQDEQADIFSIAWTISQLMATVGTFQIRMYQATDVEGLFSFRQYLGFRVLTVGLMLLSSGVYVAARGYTGEKALVVMLVCFFRAVDSLADVHEGWFQKKERLDLAGKALTYRILVAAAGFGVSLVFTKNLVFSCVTLLFSYVLCYICFDLRYQETVIVLQDEERRKPQALWIWRLAAAGAPLFINAFLMMSIMNAPKMVLDTVIGQGKLGQGAQTIFTILFMPASVLNLAYIVFRPYITKMAIVWNMGRIKEFLKILAGIGLCLLGISLFVLAGSALLGIPVLSALYAVDLSGYRGHLLLMILGGCLYTFAAVLDNALVVIRRQYMLVLVYGIAYIYSKIASRIFVWQWGIFGGALAYATAMAVFLAVITVMFVGCFFHASKEKKEEKNGKTL